MNSLRFRPFVCTLLLLLVASPGCTRLSPVTSTNSVDPSAIQIPLMGERPLVDSNIEEQEWAEARGITGQFEIRDGSPAEGVYDFILRIGATDDGLHFAMQLPNFTDNPWNTEHATYSDCISLFFTDDAPVISKPSFKIGACAGVSGYSTTHPGYWTGADWAIDTDRNPSSFNEGKPTDGTWAFGNVLNGTMFFEIYTPRFPRDTTHNGLKLQDGAVFRMSLFLMRIGDGSPEARSPDARGLFDGPHDTYPGDGYTPDGQYDPSTWIRLQMPIRQD